MRICRILLRVVLLAVVAGGLFGGYLYYEFSRDVAESFPGDPVKQFKYGSTGGERLAGIPVGIFKALPELCRDYLPRRADGTQGEGWQSLGFVYDADDHVDRPVGTSMRRSLGFDRVSLNCATCHAGTWRAEADGKPKVEPGMPSQGIDLTAFVRFLTSCALDERFNPWQVQQAAERAGAQYSWFERMLLQYVAVPAMREGLIAAKFRFRFINHETVPGPGRFDTFASEKALLNWNFDHLPAREMVGIVDFPSLWLQEPRAGMWLHWDGNNNSVEERNRSAAFGTGAIPTTADRDALAGIAAWLRSPGNVPPRYPFAIDAALAERGKGLYGQYCASCHGASGRDFSGALVGKPEPIERVRTDPCRLDNYTTALAQEQGIIYAGYPAERFSHFRKTHGYANMPLDGVWLRGPYLHNGSVPTIRDLLNPAEERPPVFYRGGDLVDQKKLGFQSAAVAQDGRALFRYETRCVDDAAICARAANPENRHDANMCVPGPWAGNSNRGHDGAEYGTALPAEDKDAIVEFLKTF